MSLCVFSCAAQIVNKIDNINKGIISTFYEPSLKEMINQQKKAIKFFSLKTLIEALQYSKVLFIS
jgi:UDP-glucose 6-dehydrogenase